MCSSRSLKCGPKTWSPSKTDVIPRAMLSEVETQTRPDEIHHHTQDFTLSTRLLSLTLTDSDPFDQATPASLTTVPPLSRQIKANSSMSA
jgi:hypothetical protein